MIRQIISLAFYGLGLIGVILMAWRAWPQLAN